MQQLIICRGLPASGKTTFSKEWVLEDPKHRVRVNRDDIRRMLGPYWVPTREDLVTRIEHNTVNYTLNKRYSVVVDATNFKDITHTWKFMQEMMQKHGKPVELIIKDFTDVPIETCIERDKNRPKEEQVGEEVIRNMAKKYKLI